jgi:deoxyribose-phosphate aldolase
MATRLGARPVAVAECGGSFAGWPEAVAKAIGPRTRAVVLASPSNPTGATLENVALIKSCVGDAIAIKAAGGIRDLDTLLEMYRLGARRFGIGLNSAMAIFEELS